MNDPAAAAAAASRTSSITPRLHRTGREKKKRVSGEARWFGYIFSSYLLIQREREREKKKEKSVESLLFLTQKGAEECLKFREGWRV